MKNLKIKYSIFAVFLITLCTGLGAYASQISVVPLGKAVGIQVYTDGLLVVGTSDVNGENIAKKYGIRVNDRIMSINGSKAESCEQFSDAVNQNPQGVTLSLKRDNLDIEVNAVPAMTEDNVYRLGLWVRDSTAGIGTLTYYEPNSQTFAALGHGINDVDTGNILSIRMGNILGCSILSVTKSSKGAPGELNGAFDGDKIGEVNINSQIGIFGKMDNPYTQGGEAIPVASREQICEGDAYILSDALGKTDKYSIKINKITDDLDKGLVIEITDQRLIDAAGGIVQGMSGSPIIQNDMLVGAVTHVFVNSPAKGYGAIAENMIDMTYKIN